MKVFVIFILAAPSFTLQEHHHLACDSCSGEMALSKQDYGPPVYYRSGSKKHKHISDHLEESNIKYAARQRRSHRHSRRSQRKHRYDKCDCDCRKCEDLQPCCQPICSNECDGMDENQMDPQSGPSPGNLVFVPYPYPLVVPQPLVPIQTTSPPPNTTVAITTSTEPSIAKEEDLVKLLRKIHRRQESPYLRNQVLMRNVRRYLPDYDMDMSTDQVDTLLSHVRNVKNINSA